MARTRFITDQFEDKSITTPKIDDVIGIGKLGLGGVTTPSESLDIAGKIKFNDNYFEVLGGVMRIRNTYGYVDISPQNGSWAHFYTDRPGFIFNKPVYSLTGSFSAHGTTNLSLQTSGTARITVLATDGNVGIGTTTPSSRLEISGGSLRLPSGAYEGAGQIQCSSTVRFGNAGAAQGLCAKDGVFTDSWADGDANKITNGLYAKAGIKTMGSVQVNKYSLEFNSTTNCLEFCFNE